MKKYFLLIPIVLIIGGLYAQPQLMNYQGVARDEAGQVLVEQHISLQISIVPNNIFGAIIYSEIHRLTTSKFGVFNIQIGGGTAVYGKFTDITWAKDNHYIKVAMDINGGSNFVTMGTTQLISVPYAFHAQTANSIYNDKTSNLKTNAQGVPSQNWSLFGNSKSDPDKDKLGTTDPADLVIVTHNVERVRILQSGEMEVRENAQFDKNINVDNIAKTDFLVVADGPNDTIPDPYPRYGSIADIRGLLIADSIAIRGGLDIGGNLKVHGDSVIVDHHLLVGEHTFLKGQVSINTQIPLTGGQGNIDAYPLKIEGSDQGIAIKVNGQRSASKNFVTFWDTYGIQGRIEGQTRDDVLNSFEYIWNNALFGIQAIELGAGIGCAAALEPCAAAIFGAEAAVLVAQTAEFNANMLDNVGVAFESGSGDYAEWLEKLSLSETFSQGDVVGVSGGKISKNLPNAKQFMVVSKSPIVLGNMPPLGKEENFEKIAFMGQVPVKVRGKVAVGDYIIASNLNDGFGIAVSSKDITLNQFERIVGVAWSESANEFGLSMINVAVGINTNDVVVKLKQQEEELGLVKNQMNNVISYLQSKDKSFNAELFKIQDIAEKVTEDKMISQENNKESHTENIQKMAKDQPEVIKNILENARNILDEKGIDYNKFEQTKRLLTDETYFLNLLQRQKE